MKKYVIATLLMSSFSMVSFAADPAPTAPTDTKRPPMGRPPQGGTRLTPEQQACVQKNLGKPGEGTPPTRERFEEVSKLCNLPRGPGPAKPETKKN